MNGRVMGAFALGALVVLAGATAFAQDAPAPAASAQPPAPAPVDSSSPAPAPAPSAAKSNGPMGYSYGGHAKSGASSTGAAPRHSRMAHHAGEALATFTGFEMLADGGSRLFVQLSKNVDVEQTKDVPVAAHSRKGKQVRADDSGSHGTNRLVFTLKGAELERYNDGNSLETMHFNTPVVRARLVPAGKDLHLIIVLRQDVTPTMKAVPAKDNGSIVQIDFPQGTYLPAGDSLVTPESAPKQPAQGALPSNDSANSESSESQ